MFKAIKAAENHSKVQAYLQAFSAYCTADSKTA